MEKFMQPTNSISTGNPARRNAARPWNQLLALPLALVLAAPACVGDVGGSAGVSGSGGSTPSGSGGSTPSGSGGSPPSGSGGSTPSGSGGSTSGTGGNGPDTGLIKSSPGPSSALLRLTSLQWENTVRDLFRLQDITGLAHDFLH